MGKAGSKHAEDTGESLVTFDPALLESLPEDLKERFQNAYGSFKDQFEELESRHDRYKVDSEQKYFELEKQLIEKNESLEGESKAATELRSQVLDLEHKYNDSSTKLREIQEGLLEKERTYEDAQRFKAQLLQEKEELAQLLDKKNHELDQTHEDVSSLSQKLKDSNFAKISAQAKADEAMSDSNIAKSRERRFQHEAEDLARQKAYLEQQLDDKNRQLLAIHGDHSKEVIDLRGQLEYKSNDCSKLEEMKSAITESNDQLNKTLEDLNQKLKESRDMQTDMEERFRNEITAQEKLITLYKESAEASENKVTEMSSAVGELQRLLKQASEANKEFEEQNEVNTRKFTVLLEERDGKIEGLQKEVKHANELLEMARRRGVAQLSEAEVEALSPSAAAASRLLKSGMTLTQIYTEYVQASESLFAEKEENKNLNEYMNQILKEIEEKAPMMKKQREDYEKAMEAVGQLTQQLETAMLECENLRQEADNCRRRSGQASRENQRLKQQTVDLGQQVRMLLKELEEAHGTVVTSGREDLNVSSDEVSSSSHLISEKLVSFRSIEELQEQNQKLLGIVRDLSEKKEIDEKHATELKTADLKKQLDTALEEIDEMKAARQRQADMVESIVRQRDMFKILLNQSSSSPLPLGRQTSTPFIQSAAGQVSPGGIPGTPRTPRTPGPEELKLQEETKAALKELQEEFNVYRKEKNKNEQFLSEQLEKFRKECSELKVQNAKLASQLDFSAERYKILQSNSEGYKKEISALRDKNQKFSTSVIKHEQTLNQLRQEAMLAQEKFSHADIQLKNMRAERDMLKTMEARLNQEKEGLIREGRSQNMLLANLQAIQNNLERSDSEMKMKHERRIENLERENSTMKRQLSDADSVNRNVVATLERQLSETKEQKDKEKENGQRMMEELHKTRQSVQQLKSELTKAEQRVSTAESRMSNVSLSPLHKSPLARPSHFPTTPSVNVEALEDKAKDLEARVQDLSKENESLKEQLNKTKSNAEQYKIIAETVEENLRDQNKTMEQFKETTEAKLKEAIEGRETAEERLSNIEKEQQELFNENTTLTQQVHSSSAELRQQLAKTQAELEEAIERRKQAIANEEAARTDCDAQLKIAQEAQDKYQRELMLHAADVEALTTVKTQLEGFNEKLQAAEEEAKSAQNTKNATEKTFAEQEQRFKEEIKKTQERVNDLQQQNTVLHEQLEKLSGQMVGLQARTEQENKELAALADDVKQGESDKSAEQLFEVIKFLRKEKEIAEARLEVIQAEANRFKQQNDYLDKQLKDSNKALSDEREQAQVHRNTASQHAEVMRKLETMNLLSDSNKLLRDEREKLAQQLREAETRVNKLEADISPIQQSLHEQEALRENLEAERTALKAEVDRWKARTNHLIEQCNKVDPEEMKKLIEERDVLKRQISGKTEEVHKQKAEMSKLTAMLQKSKSEAEAAKQQIETLNEEKGNLAKSNEEKEREVEEKNKTVLQLRRIGQKYRTQAQTMQKELDELKEKQAGAGEEEQKHTEQVQTLEQKVKEAEEKLTQVEENMKTLESEKETAMQCVRSTEEKVIGLEQELNSTKARLGVVEAEKQMVQQALDEKEGMLKEREVASQSSTGQVSALQEELKKLKDGEEKSKKDLTDSEKKINQYKMVLVKGQNKIKDQQAQIEKHLKEIAELKERSTGATGPSKEESELRFNTLKSQFESTKTRLEKELAEAKKENAELQQKIQNLQKQIGSQPVKAQPQQAATKPTVSAQPVERSPASSGDTPRTANIRPMAGPAGHQARQSAPVQPVRSTVDTRAMASIRPMVPQPTVTPTATVMPTTVTIPDDQTSTQVRRTQQVQPVSPVIDAPQAEIVTETVTPVEPVASTSRTTPPPAAQAVVPSQSVAPSNKRQRDDTDSQEVTEVTETPVKRSRTQEVVETQQEAAATAIVQVEPLAAEVQEPQGSAPVVALVEPTQQPDEFEAVEPEEAAVESVVEPLPDDSQEDTEGGADQVEQEAEVTEEQGEEQAAEAEQDSQQDDVVVLGSDEEESETQGEYVEGVEYNEEQGEGQEQMDEYVEGQEEYEDDGYQMEGEDEIEGDEVEDYDDGMQDGEEEVDTGNDEVETVEEDDDDGDVVIVDSEEEPDSEMVAQDTNQSQQNVPTGGQQAQSVPQQASTGQAQLPLRVPLMRADSRTRSQQAMPPFSLAVPGVPTGTFEEGDDSIVPSTPTLFVPRRTDGFAEAVSSPQVPHGGFTFGASTDSGMPGEPLLAIQGMDDTRMDLTQFDDGVGRSGPATPRTRSPPTISITEAPSGDGDDGVEEVVPLEVQEIDSQDSQVPQQQEETASEDQSADTVEEIAVEELTEDAGEDIERIADVPEDEAVSSQEEHTGAGDSTVQSKSDSSATSSGAQERAQSQEKMAKPRPKIEPILWTDSDTRQFSSDGNRQSALDGIRQAQVPRRGQQNVATRQQVGRRGAFQPGRRGAPSMRGGMPIQSQPIPRIGGQGQVPFMQQQQQHPQQQQFMQQRPMPGLMGRGAGGFPRGQRSRGRGGPFRGGR